MCHICKQRSDADGLTRKKWFACGYCLLSNEEGIRPFYGQGTGKGRGKGTKGYASDEDLEEHAHKGARKGKGCSTKVSDDDEPKGKDYHGDGAAGMDAAAPCGDQATGSSQPIPSSLTLQRIRRKKRRKTAHSDLETDG